MKRWKSINILPQIFFLILNIFLCLNFHCLTSRAMDSRWEYFWTNSWPPNDYWRSVSLPCGHQFCHENWKLLPDFQGTGFRKRMWDQLMLMTGDQSKTQDFEHRWPAGPVCCLPPGRDKLRWADPRVAFFLYMIGLWFRDVLPLGTLTLNSTSTLAVSGDFFNKWIFQNPCFQNPLSTQVWYSGLMYTLSFVQIV